MKVMEPQEVPSAPNVLLDLRAARVEKLWMTTD